MVLPHVQSASDLVTSPDAVREGFLLQALRKTEKAEPYIEEARRLFQELSDIRSIEDVANCQAIQQDLLYAAGFSNKARARLSNEELQQLLQQVLTGIERNAGNFWREELVYRFLLTKGETLGGSMRNLTGSLASKQFVQSVIHALNRISIEPQLTHNRRKKLESLSWGRRLLIFDKKPKFIGNSIDVILLNIDRSHLDVKEAMETKECYIACGELKGGIDPAGADEHWKTARSALERIRKSFAQARVPKLFFVGAAIEQEMANEIFVHLKDGSLSYAANFTKPKQLEDLASWLVSL